MKNIVFALFLALPLISNAQAHLGESFSGLKTRYPDKYFIIEYTDEGTKYTSVEFNLGIFIYYFDKATNLTNACIQIPHSITALNAQVEIYNNKYVIVSETSWKAYLEGGGIMNINLTYESEYDLYVFYYSD